MTEVFFNVKGKQITRTVFTLFDILKKFSISNWDRIILLLLGIFPKDFLKHYRAGQLKR